MRAIILAAGEGSRLRPYTADRPKCTVELAGRPLIEHQIASLHAVGVEAITIVTGYRAESIESLGHPTRHNPDYATTNMVASLMCAADLLDGTDDALILYADIVYEPRVVRALIGCHAPLATTIDKQWLRLWKLRAEDPIADAETLKLDGSGNITELGKKPKSLNEIEAQYMGLIKTSAAFAPELTSIYKALDPAGPYDGKDRANMYMTSFLQRLIDTGHPLRAVLVDGGWLEIDTAGDLELYNRLYDEGELREFCDLETIAKGGVAR